MELFDPTWAPEMWEGTPISWDGSERPVSEMILHEREDGPIARRLGLRDVQVYKTRWPSKDFRGLSLPADSCFVEYALTADGGVSGQRLWLATKLPFCVDGRRCGRFVDRLGYVLASKAKPQVRRGTEYPNWKWSEAMWPVLDGSLLQFAGSIPVPQSVPGAIRVVAHLFFWRESSELKFCIFEELLPVQSLKRHYAEEDRRGRG